MNTKTTTEISSHFAFGEHWNEVPEYQGYLPIGQSWSEIKEELFDTLKHNLDKPLFLNIVKNKGIKGIYVYGFKIDDKKLCVALCKILATKELVAIAW